MAPAITAAIGLPTGGGAPGRLNGVNQTGRETQMTVSREIRLKSRPVGSPTADNFDLVSVTLPEPGPGEV